MTTLLVMLFIDVYALTICAMICTLITTANPK